jgi:hypothetical protein
MYLKVRVVECFFEGIEQWPEGVCSHIVQHVVDFCDLAVMAMLQRLLPCLRAQMTEKWLFVCNRDNFTSSTFWSHLMK